MIPNKRMQFERTLSEHHFAAPKGQEVPQAKEGHSCTGVHQGDQGDYAQIMLLSLWKSFFLHWLLMGEMG